MDSCPDYSRSFVPDKVVSPATCWRVIGMFFLGFAGLQAEPASVQTAERVELENGDSVRYLQYLPKDYPGDGKLYPVLLFLHGGGECGDDLEKVKVNGPPRLVEEGWSVDCIILSPQNPEEIGFWDEDLLARFLDSVLQELPADPDRIYLSGLSRGGYGAWRLALENPHRFAAVVTISGAAPAPYAVWWKDTPVRIYHGALDPLIPVEESIRMAEALEQRGVDVKLTVYPDGVHDAWSRTYADPAMWEWMLSQSRSDPAGS